MPEHHEIYDKNADIYDNLVSHEDYEGNLLNEIKRLVPLTGKDIVGELCDYMKDNNTTILPECTGFWSFKSNKKI